MPDPGLIVRALETPAEIDVFFRLGIQSFAPEIPSEELAKRAEGWRDAVLRMPSYVPGQLRGAFLADGTFVGGCNVYERWMSFGPARLRTGCVNGVLTLPDYRHRGVGTAIMMEALSYAQSRGQALLLLDGIPGFYRRLGYADVLDITEHAIAGQEILAQPPSPYSVRTATPDDASAVLGLYRRHFGPYPGSFERSLEEQRGMIESRPPFNPIPLAVGEDGAPRGYLLFDEMHRGAHAAEITAEDWLAALALLQHHARGVASSSAPESELWWPLPPDSATLYDIAERLPVHSHTKINPDSDWMARPASLPALFRSLLPLWHERWARHAAPWAGVLALEVGNAEGAACALELGPSSLKLVEFQPGQPHTVRLSPQAFTQLVFGYRSVSWAARQAGQSVPAELRPALEVLLPRVQAWIPGSDTF